HRTLCHARAMMDISARPDPGLQPDLEPGSDPAAVEPAPSLVRFYGFQLVAEIGLTGGTWILYLQHLGLSLTQIGIAEAVFHLAPSTLELPSGSLADVFGRKWSLALSSLCVALSAFLMLIADNIWMVLPAMYLSGASFAFRSGTM